MQPTLPASVVVLVAVLLTGGVFAFFAWGRVLLRVQSFQTLMNNLATGKEQSILLKIMFLGSNSVFKSYYDWQLKMAGDRAMTLLLHLLGYGCMFSAVMTIVGLAVFLIVQI